MRKMMGRILRFLRKIVVFVMLLWVTMIILFAFLPVPYSMVMLERQLSAWSTFNFSYVARSTWAGEDAISQQLKLAVIASEDQNFPHHYGFDFGAISDVLSKRGKKGGAARGASTLSQQTVKNLFLWDGRSWVRKGLETLLTPGIELVWSKSRILTVYLNIAEFGPGIFGAEAAAQHFFGKSAKNLTAAEAALLAAVLPNPHRLHADKPSAYLRQRQQWILHQMQLLGGTGFLKKNNLADN
ncbi:monofunctional biosynthetic peptidoglycan transglycosylase [Morganella morganii]|uniref:monofunctional biosynthetic peptidoglycan transglycosylase n=1 Tax=Morganella morganii TaxID=582 RepID=UPI0023689FE4|nr:monofunctional biosynthetic peptidoglycan transglycosylase [Morganella morganii]